MSRTEPTGGVGRSDVGQRAETPRLLHSFSWVIVANLARQVSFLVVNAYLYVQLTRSTFGTVSLAFGYMTVFIGLGDFGIRHIGWREIARHREAARTLIGSLLGAKLVTVTLAIGLYVALKPYLWEPTAPGAIYLLFGLGIALNASTLDFPFFGLSRVDLVAKYSLLAFAAYLVGCVALVRAEDRGWLVPVIFATAMAILLGLQLRWFRHSIGSFRPSFELAALRRVLAASWPLGIGETLNRLAASYPVILIGMAVGSEGVGNYRIAEMLFSFLAQFGQMYAAAGFSQLSHIFQHNRAALPGRLSRMLWPALAAAAVAGLGFSLVGPHALRWVFEDTSDETLRVVRILGLALVFAGPARMLKGLLASIDRQGLLLLTNSISISVGLAIGWWTIPVVGISGMAVGVLGAEFVSLLVLVVAYWRALRVGDPD